MPGLAAAPVSATRSGWKIFPAPIPCDSASPRNCSSSGAASHVALLASDWRAAASIEPAGDKNRANDGEILENHPKDRFAFRAQDKDGSYANTFTLQPAGQGTKVTFRLDFLKVNGMAALAVPLLFPLVGKKDIRARMQMLKTRVEASGH